MMTNSKLTVLTSLRSRRSVVRGSGAEAGRADGLAVTALGVVFPLTSVHDSTVDDVDDDESFSRATNTPPLSGVTCIQTQKRITNKSVVLT